MMFENADTIKEFPLTVFRISDVSSQLLQNQMETLRTRSDVKVRVGKRNCAGFRRSPKATLSPMSMASWQELFGFTH